MGYGGADSSARLEWLSRGFATPNQRSSLENSLRLVSNSHGSKSGTWVHSLSVWLSRFFLPDQEMMAGLPEPAPRERIPEGSISDTLQNSDVLSVGFPLC